MFFVVCAKIVQIESRNAKLAWEVMPSYRLFSAKIVQIGLKNNSICTFF